MKKSNVSLILFLPVLALVSVLYLRGAASVPFHPDESTQIFMSSDVELFARDPSALFWRAESAADPRQRYHLLDAPLTRYLIGLGRQIVRLPALPVDWDWSKRWAENERAGALPSSDLLLASRVSVAWLFPLSVLLLFLAARRAFGAPVAWIAALLLASNALILLHTRRAMAESALTFTLCLTLWAFVSFEKRPWLSALPAALAFCAKQSLVGLAPIGLIAIFWQPEAGVPVVTKVRQSTLYLLLYGLVIILLNPFLWRAPLPALQAAIQARQDLAAAQMADRPGQTLSAPGLRVVAAVGAVYLTPPIFEEVSNYVDQTHSAELTYLNSPLNNLFRSMPVGGLMLALSLAGFLFAARYASRGIHRDPRCRPAALILLAAVLQTLTVLATVPLPWQRYFVSLIPFACLWVAYGVESIRAGLWRAARKSRASGEPSLAKE